MITSLSLPQALTKSIPIAEFHRDAQVASWFVEDKLTRQAAWGCLRGLLAQLEALGIDRPATRSRLPDDVCVRPVEQGEEIVVDDHGNSYLSKVDGETTVVLPPGFTVHSMLIIANVIDRGSIGSAAVNFAKGGAGMTWTDMYGDNHDAWNAVRGVAKAKGGAVWRAIVRLSSIQILPYGPFRSGAWGRRLQDDHLSLTEELTMESSEFIVATQNQ